MDSKQIDFATRKKIPVLHNGKKYTRILEYVFWYDHRGRQNLSAVLLAGQGNYTIRVPAEKVQEFVEADQTEAAQTLEETCTVAMAQQIVPATEDVSVLRGDIESKRQPKSGVTMWQQCRKG